MTHDVVMTHVRAHLYDMSIRRLHLLGRDGDDVAAIRARFERTAPRVWPRQGIRITPVEAGGVPGEWVDTKQSAADRILLYLHGGGWFMGSPHSYRSLVADLAGAARIRALTLDFRLAPEHPYPAALDDCVAAYEWLLTNGISPDHIVVAGDSSGGNLAMALALRLRDAGRPLPAGLVLLSPLMDLTLSGESHVSRRNLDPYFAGASLEPVIARYVPLGEALGPYLSPLQADLRGLPPMLVHVGDREILRDDALRIAERASAAGVDARAVVWPGMMHVFQVFAPYLPDARRANKEIGAFIRTRTALV